MSCRTAYSSGLHLRLFERPGACTDISLDAFVHDACQVEREGDDEREPRAVGKAEAMGTAPSFDRAVAIAVIAVATDCTL